MKIFIPTKLKEPAFFRALMLALALCFANAPAAAQHEGHGAHQMQNAPAKKARRSSAKPRKKVKKAVRSRASARTRKKRATARRNNAPRGMSRTSNAHAEHTPRAQPTNVEATKGVAPATPAQGASQRHEGHQQTAPTAAPQATEATKDTHATHQHAAQPTASPNTKESPTSINPQTPAEAKDEGAHQHHQAGTTPQTGDAKEAKPTPPTPAAQDPSHAGHNTSKSAAPAAQPADLTDHSAHGGESSGGGLMVMEGERMGVRVGASASNFMPMGQMGSGTAWQPGSSPMYMWHKTAGEWLLMLHGEAKLGVNSQGGPRGVTKFESQNWLMPMAYRKVGRGTLQLRGMFSLEPLTFSGAGSPQLFQTGEVYQGQPIRDFQHPHDLFMELSAQYTLPLGERGTWYAYFGFPGEPALGPVAFMHRPSASENPTAPLTHHLQDSTHISFGVLTSGFTYRWLKLEGSIFNGREPDDKRYGFEFNPFNSRSVRVSVAPNENWAVQYSYGLLKNPEFFSPGDTRRQTASVQYNRPLRRGNLAAALIWGRNREEHDGETFRLNGYTAEATFNFLDRNYLYTRLELVDREGDDLLNHEELHDLGFGDHQHPQFRVGAYTFGAARDFWETEKLSVALGGDVTFYSKPAVLDALYGSNPTSYKFFIRLRPRSMKMTDHSGHGAN